MQPETILKVHDVHKQYVYKPHLFAASKKIKALKGVSFQIHKGEIFGLLGSNGAGKSTLINILIGLLEYEKGEIHIFDRELKKNDEFIRNRMNIATTYAQLPSHLTGEENLKVFALLYNVQNKKEMIEEVLNLMDAHELRKTQIGKMSAGQKTKMNLCKALINNPKLLLLDEPTASLDPETAHHIRKQLKFVQKKRKMTIIFTSHNMAEVEEMCDRVAFLSQGKIYKINTPENLVKLIDVQEVVLHINNEREIKIPKNSLYTVIQKSQETIRLRIPHQKGSVLEFLNWLRQNNITFYDVEIRPPGLEDVFVQIAKK